MITPRLSSSELSHNVAADRRSSTRYFLDPISIAVQDEKGGVLEAQLTNVSAEGAGVLLRVRPEREAYLRLELPTKEEPGTRRLLARVRNIESYQGQWRVGCVFCRRLDDAELLGLL